jgi:zinc protease
MARLWLVVLSILMLAGCSSHYPSVSLFSLLPKGITLVEKVDTIPGKAMIPYSKYRLDNGMTVILSPDHSDPLVHVDVTYHVGSARETEGKTGFAHFFEHMMFQGSKNVGDQQHFKIITEAGGTLNGTTDRDKTHYYETVPANQLEKVLWLESDRMGFLLDAVSQKKFEIQRDTVKNERAQNYDNRPYGLIWERMGEAMYPPSHPYSWQTIGYVEDLDRVDVNDLKAFFLRWYGPNNATLTIGGDIDIKQTLKWIAKYYGSLPKGPDVVAPEKMPVTLPNDRFVTMEDRIQQPMVIIGWPTESLGADNQVPLDVLSRVLGSGSNSLLYQSLVKTNKALSAGSFQDCGELSCTFYLYAMTASKDPAALKTLYHELMDVVEKLHHEGVDRNRLEEIKGMAQADSVFALESVEGKVSQLAYNETFFGQPDRIQEDLKKLSDVNVISVDNVFEQYLLRKHHVVLSVVPKGKANIAVKPSNFTPLPHQSAKYKKILDNQLSFRKVNDAFDRSMMPKVAAPVTATIPELYDHYFSNGMELMGTYSPETPTVLFELKLPAGERYVPRGKEGLAELTAALMEEGTTTKSAEMIQSQLDKLGSSISFSASHYTTTITVSALKANFPQTLSILDNMLFHPRFSPDDLARIKQQMIQGAVYQHQKLTWLASQATRQVLFGDSLFSRVADGTEKSIDSLTLNDVKEFYHTHYTPHGAQLISVGDISKKEILKQVQFLADWAGNPAPLLAPQLTNDLSEQKVYVVDKPGATQSIVRFVRKTIPFDATGELYLSQLANFNLAGNFNSRINQNLREDKGYTYGMSGYLESNREEGVAVFNAPVRADSTLASIIEIRKEMANYASNGMTKDELKFMRLAVGQQEALMYETPGQKADLISGIMTYSLDNDYLQQRNRIAANVKKSILDKMAAKWFNPNDYQIIVVGDMKTLMPQLEKLNLPIAKVEIIR